MAVRARKTDAQRRTAARRPARSSKPIPEASTVYIVIQDGVEVEYPYDPRKESDG